MFLTIVLAVVIVGIIVISLGAQKESPFLEFLVREHANLYVLFHIVLSFYGAVLGSFGKHLREKSFQNVLLATGPIYGSAVEKDKTNLLDQLKEQKGRLTVCEIGIGTGTNFRYYPKACDLIAVEPNPEFRATVENNLKPYKGIHLKEYLQITGENLSPIQDESVDVVLTSIVLCSVEDVDRTLKEIKRVLKPGGKYFFVEHVLDSPGTLRNLLQYLATVTHFWPLVFLGCSFRDISSSLKRAGFTSVKGSSINLTFSESLKFLFMVSPHYLGVATK